MNKTIMSYRTYHNTQGNNLNSRLFSLLLWHFQLQVRAAFLHLDLLTTLYTQYKNPCPKPEEDKRGASCKVITCSGTEAMSSIFPVQSVI